MILLRFADSISHDGSSRAERLVTFNSGISYGLMLDFGIEFSSNKMTIEEIRIHIIKPMAATSEP